MHINYINYIQIGKTTKNMIMMMMMIFSGGEAGRTAVFFYFSAQRFCVSKKTEELSIGIECVFLITQTIYRAGAKKTTAHFFVLPFRADND